MLKIVSWIVHADNMKNIINPVMNPDCGLNEQVMEIFR